MELSELHDCKKCHNKMVLISCDALGVTRCGYCGEPIRYDLWFEQEMKKRRGDKNKMQ